MFPEPDSPADSPNSESCGRSHSARRVKDGTGHYLTEQLHSGVWLSNEPLDCNEGAKGDVLLEVALDRGEDDFAAYEWLEEGGAPWLNGATLACKSYWLEMVAVVPSSLVKWTVNFSLNVSAWSCRKLIAVASPSIIDTSLSLRQ